MVMLILLPFRWKLLYHFDGVLHFSFVIWNRWDSTTIKDIITVEINPKHSIHFQTLEQISKNS